MEVLATLLVLAICFLADALVFWLLTLLLPVFGIVITFTWGKALAFWGICILIRILFKSSKD